MHMETVAVVNHGRWVAECPAAECPEAHKVTPPADLFKCGNCGATAAVTFPAGWPAISAVLALRPVPQTRNWTPPETVADLTAENATRGL